MQHECMYENKEDNEKKKSFTYSKHPYLPCHSTRCRRLNAIKRFINETFLSQYHYYLASVPYSCITATIMNYPFKCDDDDDDDAVRP